MRVGGVGGMVGVGAAPGLKGKIWSTRREMEKLPAAQGWFRIVRHEKHWSRRPMLYCRAISGVVVARKALFRFPGVLPCNTRTQVGSAVPFGGLQST